MSESPSRRELIVTGVIAGCVTLVAAIAYYGVDIATGASLFFTHDLSGSDLWHLNYPMKHFFQQELGEGRFPLWCPSIGTGYPLHAEGQVAALYLPNILLYSWLPLPLAFNWGILLHVALAGAFAAMFARQLGAMRSTAMIAAIVFAFAGFYVTHVKHLNMTASAVWIPLLLLLLERHAARPHPMTMIAITLTVAMTVLGGHPQIAYQNLLIAGFYGLYLVVRVWRTKNRGRTGALRYLGGLVYAVALGALLTLPQVLPTMELNAVGPRAGGMTFEEATQWEYQWKHLSAFVVPGAFGDPGVLTEIPARDPRSGQMFLTADGNSLMMASGGFEQDPEHPMLYWEMTAYAGLLPLLLAVAALGLGWRRRNVLVVSALLGVSILLALGKNGGLLHLFWHVVPGFKLFRFHDRYLLYADLAIAVLASLGVTMLAARLLTGERAKYAIGVAVAVAVFCWGDLFQALGDHNPKVPTERWTETPTAVEAIREDAGENAPPFRVVTTDAQRRVFSNAYNRARGWKGDLTPYDVARNALDPNYNILFGVELLHIYYQLYPRWMNGLALRYFAPADPTPGFESVAGADRVANLYNVRYAIAPRDGVFEQRGNPVNASLSRDREIARLPGGVFEGAIAFDRNQRAQWSTYDLRVYANPDAKPRAFLVPSARVVAAPPRTPDAFPADVRAAAKGLLGQGAPLQVVAERTRVPISTLAEWRADALGGPDVAEVFAKSFDPAREVVIYRDGDAEPPRGTAGGPIDTAVEIVKYGPQRVRLKTTAPQACWLFLSDTWYPGWEATVNGEAAKVWRANGAGRAVWVPAGAVDVVFRYAPSSFSTGAWIALLALLLLATTPLVARLLRLA